MYPGQKKIADKCACVGALWIAMGILFVSCSGNNSNSSEGNDRGTADKSTGVTPVKKGKRIQKENTLIDPMTLAESSIKGRVKYVSYSRYSGRGKSRRALKAKGYFSYNAAGYLLCHNEYKADGTQVTGCLYNYDDENRATEWDVMDVETERDSKIIFKYDAKGNIAEEIIDDKEPKYSVKELFRYDQAGNETEEKDYAADGRLKGTISSKYDRNGNQVELSYHSAPDNVVRNKITCTYDDKGNETEGKKYSSDKAVVSKWTCRNNDSGKCIEKIYYTPEGQVTLKNTFSYDAKGNLTEFNYYHADGSLNEEDSYSFEYAYDKTGNLTRRARFIKKAGKKIQTEHTEYDIQYY